MKTPVKVTIVTAAVVLMLLLGALIYVLVSHGAPGRSESDGAAPQLLRENSHVLDQGGDNAVTVVEFLDFECEACGALYPIVEELRAQYAEEITYVVRYFPLPRHFNSKTAAIAAEAAAQQGRFEDMYHRLFETQSEWGEAQESHAALFRSFAEELGLDIAAYDASFADPATASRVEQDFEEGRALGVSSTPTFFVNGELLEVQQWGDLEAAIEAGVNP